MSSIRINRGNFVRHFETEVRLLHGDDSDDSEQELRRRTLLANRIKSLQASRSNQPSLAELAGAGMSPENLIELAAACCDTGLAHDTQEEFETCDDVREAKHRFGLWAADCLERFVVTFGAGSPLTDFLSTFRRQREGVLAWDAYLAEIDLLAEPLVRSGPQPIAVMIEGLWEDEARLVRRREELRGYGEKIDHVVPAYDPHADARLVTWLASHLLSLVDCYIEAELDEGDLSGDDQEALEWRSPGEPDLVWEAQRLCHWFDGKAPGAVDPVNLGRLLPGSDCFSVEAARRYAVSHWS
jgi:hypothetical protein